MDTKKFVSDSLKTIGLSDRYITEYLIAISKEYSSYDGFIERVNKDKLIKTKESFFTNIWPKLPHKALNVSQSVIDAEKFKQNELKKRSYSLVLSDDEQIESKKSKDKSKKHKKSKDIKKALRKRNESESEDETTIRRSARDKNKDSSASDDEKEIKARNEFSERLKKRDQEKTRKIMSKSDKKAAEEAMKRLHMESSNKEIDFANLRKISRREYMGKRQKDKIEDLEMELEDEKYIFGDVKLTKREKVDVQYKEQVLHLGKELRNATESEKQNRYHLPEAGRNINVPYFDDYSETAGNYEQHKWEDENIQNATSSYGARDAKMYAKKDEYELILDEEIEFMKDVCMPGSGDFEEKGPSADELKRQSIQENKESLPIFSYKKDLLEAIRDHQVLIIEGETGSGKTTQLPQYLHETGFTRNGQKIGCTQPRRVAAMSVSKRVSEEMRVKLGNEVGYSIRFEDCTSERTVIKYMTDGMLLREFLNEPDLASYSVMIIDEAHERTLHTDILFGLMKDIICLRSDLKLIISSATLDAEKFSSFFNDAPIFRIPGRRFPVDIYYTKTPEADYIDAAVISILQIHVTQPLGDVLVFLTGQEEIETVQELLLERTRKFGKKLKEMIILPIYANLPTDMQAKVFIPTPPGARKVVLATNIAETSLTIDGITFVIDVGFCKMNSYNAKTGIESLVVTPISKAMANQRTGRAGRVSAGKCFRLYTQWTYLKELEENTIPEIQRVNLANVVLILKSLGIDDLLHFEFMDRPPHHNLIQALELLYALGAFNKKGQLTMIGRKMAEFPVDPQISKSILASEKYKCTEEIITIASMLSVNSNIFYRPKNKLILADTARKNFNQQPDALGDHFTLLNVYNRWVETEYSTQWCYENYVQHRSLKRARDVREQLEGLLERVEIDLTSTTDTVDIRKAITAGFFYHTASLSRSGEYKTVKHQQNVFIHPNSCLFDDRPRWIIYHELVFTSKDYMRQIVTIENSWLLEVAPHFYKSKGLDSGAAKKIPKQMGKSRKELTR